MGTLSGIEMGLRMAGEIPYKKGGVMAALDRLRPGQAWRQKLETGSNMLLNSLPA